MPQNNKNLKICVSSAKDTLDSDIDPRFGRCEYFMIVEVENGSILNIKAVKNSGAQEDRGAGINAAQQIGELGVNILITGDVGPKAADILNQLGIKVYKKSGVARVAVSEYLNDEMTDQETKEDIQSKDQRIFIPLMDDKGENSEISLHFGHAPYFGLYDAASKQFVIKENQLEHSDPNKSPVDQVVEAVNPTIVFAQDMGARAINLFAEKNILLKTGPFKTVKEVIENLDKLENLTDSCKH